MRSLTVVLGVSLSLVIGAGDGWAQAKVQAGVSAAVKGRVEVASLGTTVGRVAKSGEDIFLGDRVSSGRNSGMQVLLLDETVFTIGANSALTIDEFVYNPDTGGGKVAAQVLKGAFRFVTGRIAQRRPQAMAVKLPVGSIGVRGTIAAGRIDGSQALVVLLGPGTNTDTNERIGRITVSNAGETVDITRAGFATTIDGPGAAPVEPFRLPLADLRALTQALTQPAPPRTETETGQAAATQSSSSEEATPTEGDAASSDSSEKSGTSTATTSASTGTTDGTSDLAGEGQVSAEQNAVATLDTAQVGRERDRLVEDSVQDQPDSQLPDIVDGVSSFDEIRRIQSGTHAFVIDTAFVQTQIDGVDTNLPGNVNVTLAIDFGARTLGGGNSGISMSTTAGGGNIDFSTSIPLNDYSQDTGLAEKTFGDDPGDAEQIRGSRIEILNADGIIAQKLRADIKFDDSQGNRGLGAGESGSRVTQ